MKKDITIDDLPPDTIDKLYEIVKKHKRRKETRNDIYSILQDFPGRYVILIGGSGSGKSYEIADHIIDRLTEEPKSRILCLRAEGKQVSLSQFPLLRSRVKANHTIEHFKINEGKGSEKIQHKSGAETLFSGLDDVEKLKSIFDITSIWAEEADQILEQDISELDRRLRGYAGLMQIYLSFNPVSVLSWPKKMFFDDKVKEYLVKDNGLEVTKRLNRTICLRGERTFEDYPNYKDAHYTKGQLNEKILVWSDEKKEYTEEYLYNTLIIHSTYLDNRFIDDNYYQVMQKMKATQPEEYYIYGLGQWGISGGTYFDKANVNAQIVKNILPVKQGYFEFTYKHEKIVDDTIHWVDDKEGYIKIYEEPKKCYPYVGSGDTSGEGSDWNVGSFTNNVTEEDAAVLRYQYDEDLYARQMYCLGKYYNNAMLGIETNFSTHPVKELQRLGYPNQYIREEKSDTFTGKLKPVFGFNTNKETRPNALGMLKALVRDYPERIKDLDTLFEMTTFVKNEEGRPGAAKGMHDDCVMSRAINCFIAHQQTREIGAHSEIDYKKLERMTEDAQDDFYNANEELKKRLADEWKLWKDM